MKRHTYFLLLSFIIILLSACSGKTNTVTKLAENNEEAVSYTDRKVSADDIERLTDVGAATPCNRQIAPWQFYAIGDGAIAKLRSIRTLGNGLGNAPAAIMICGLSRRFGGGDTRNLWQQDCAAAAQNIILTARAMNLTPNKIAIYPMQQKVIAVKEAFDLDPGVIPFTIIALGHAEETRVLPLANQQKVVTLGTFDD